MIRPNMAYRKVNIPKDTKWVEISEDEFNKIHAPDYYNVYPIQESPTTYTKFGPVDSLVAIDDKVIGEITGITWEIQPDRPQEDKSIITGILKYLEFSKDPFITAKIPIWSGNKFHIDIIHDDEYGNKSIRSFYGVKFGKMSGGLHIDDAGEQEKTLEWTAELYVPLRHMQPGEHSRANGTLSS
jgi:hypothetical protein